ncbi:hypothetical protein Tco_0295076 [Tanacetum coccineum]
MSMPPTRQEPKEHSLEDYYAQARNEVCSESSYFSDENLSIDDLALDNELKWTTPTLLWKSVSGLRKKKLVRLVKVYNWETATYGKIWDNEDVHDLGSVETEFLAIAFNDTLTSEATLSYDPMVSSLNYEIDFKISFDESDDEDFMVSIRREFNVDPREEISMNIGVRHLQYGNL